MTRSSRPIRPRLVSPRTWRRPPSPETRARRSGNSATSFFNNQAAQQTATGNWWGAAAGPNTPGADTVGGNVDTGGFLTAPILGCLPHVYLPLVLCNYP